MKVFVAIESLDDGDDFSYTVPGEMVHFPPVVCDCPECGCERSMAGFMSHRATTSFVVRDLDVNAATYTDMLLKTLADAGWVTEGSGADRRWVAPWAVEHMEMAAEPPVDSFASIVIGSWSERPSKAGPILEPPADRGHETYRDLVDMAGRTQRRRSPHSGIDLDPASVGRP